MNPLNSILQKYKEDDFIVFKLDIDINSIELPLAQQLLAGGVNGTYHRLIDQFYFEHHVHLSEIVYAWNETMKGTIKDTLDLFYGLCSALPHTFGLKSHQFSLHAKSYKQCLMG